MNEQIPQKQMALVVVDMQKDNVGRFCHHIVPKIARLIQRVRDKGMSVFFACDSRYPDDFIFTRGKHPVSTIRGTEGVKVIDELQPAPGDIVVEKRMLSAFFATDLDFTLRHRGIRGLIVTGVATWACVLKTAFDAVELGYEVVVPADCCASPSVEDHEAALKVLERLRVLRPTADEVLDTVMR